MRSARALVFAASIGALTVGAFARTANAEDRHPKVVRPVPSGPDYSFKRQSMFGVLGAWSVASMGAGAGLAFGGPNDFDRFMGIQALAWGAVNLVFTAWGEAQSRTNLFTTPDSAEVVKKDAASLSRAFWVSALFDVGFVIVGTLLWNLGSTDAVRGTGAGIVTQGGFLFGFDTLGYMLFR